MPSMGQGIYRAIWHDTSYGLDTTTQNPCALTYGRRGVNYCWLELLLMVAMSDQT